MARVILVEFGMEKILIVLSMDRISSSGFLLDIKENETMKIKFLQNYKSIEGFNEKEIKDFSIFTGLNGAGKTHILESIHEGFIKVDNIHKDEIIYFNFTNFLLQNQSAASAVSVVKLKKFAWNFLQQQKQNFLNFDQQIKNCLKSDPEIFYQANTENIKDDEEDNYKKIREQILNFIGTQHVNNPKQSSLLKSVLWKSSKALSEIGEREFIEKSDFDYLDYHLLSNLSEIFLEHKRKIALGGVSKDKKGTGLSQNDLEKLENNSPWNFINRIFKDYGLAHEVNAPIVELGDFINNPDLSFQIELRINNKVIQFGDLSSGEKILVALAITVFQDSKSKFPKLILLDEIDATLHPSMIEKTLDVINNIFVKNGSKVIMATHSPTTIAHASEDSIYEIKKGYVKDKIVDVDKARALSILTAGFLTFEEGMGIVQKQEPQIHLEGTTDIDYWKKALSLFGDEYKILKTIKTVDGNGGESKTTYNNLRKVSENYILSKHIFVFDCDESKAERLDGKLLFVKNDKNKKSLVEKGIENLFNEDVLTRAYSYKNDFFEVSNVTSRGSNTIKYTVHPDEKRNLCNWICENATKEDFLNFEPLFNKIKNVLSDNS